MNLQKKHIAVAAICLAISLSFGCKKEESAPAPAQPAPQPQAQAPAQPQAPAPASASEFSASLPSALEGKKIVPGGKAAVDAVNKSGDKVVSVKSTEKFDINGWAFDDKSKSVSDTVFVELTPTKGGNKYYLPVNRSPRPDLASTFNEPAYSKAGYNKKGDIKAVAAGEYQINVIQVVDGNPIEAGSGKKVKVD